MSTPRPLADLRAALPAVLPSILRCDFGNLESEIHRLEEAGAKAIHLDVMDGHFVPNLSFGFPVIAMIRRLTDLPLDVHLMIANPQPYLARYVEAGADLLTVHAEVLDDARPVLDEIRSLGAAAGLAINPPTPVDSIRDAETHCDLVLVMSVMPGFGGQTFDQVALEKLRTLRSRLPNEVLLEVDGGVNADTIAACADAGAQLLVAGSAITDGADYRARLQSLTQLTVGGR